MKKRKEKFNKGFTLLEVMAVLLIIGLLAGIAVKNFMGQIQKGEVVQTEANLKVLHEAVQLFRMDTGRYPSDDEGLIVLIEEPLDAEGWQSGGYLETSQIPRDGWKNDFIYMSDPGGGKPFVIISYGADGEPEGEGRNADLWSTDIN